MELQNGDAKTGKLNQLQKVNTVQEGSIGTSQVNEGKLTIGNPSHCVCKRQFEVNYMSIKRFRPPCLHYDCPICLRFVSKYMFVVEEGKVDRDFLTPTL